MASPLYDTLEKTIKKTNVTKKEISYMLEMIPTLNQSSNELFYMLIWEHYRRNNKWSISLPYKGKQTEDGILYDLNNIPEKIKRILLAFIKLDKNKVK